MPKEFDDQEQTEIHAAAKQFLKLNSTMVLASISPTGEPAAATVYFVHSDTENPYDFQILTTKGSRKCDNLTANGKVAFVVGAGPDTATMQGGGVAEPLTGKDAEIFFKLVERISLTQPYQFPLLTLAKERGFCAFRIRPTWLTWLVLDEDEYPDLARKEFYKLL